MSVITSIKNKILELGPGEFQEFCDIYLSKKGYKNIMPFGMKSGTGKTTKGIPDTYFINKDNKYIFVMYTTALSGVKKKIEDDIDECLDKSKTGVNISEIDKIIYCHTSANLSAGNDKELREKCQEKGISLFLKGIDLIATDIYNNHHDISRDCLGISISSGQVLSIDEFISNYDARTIVAPISTKFLFRDIEISNITDSINHNEVTVITGATGVGKTKLALECSNQFAINMGYKLFCIQSYQLPIYDDLVITLAVPGKYLIMIDDANELTYLKNVLLFFTRNKEGYNIKVVLTIRNYALKLIEQVIRGFTKPEIFRIEPFNDDEIIEIVNENFNINNFILNRIVVIAEGNARIAMLAGKLIKDKKSLDHIRNASELYEEYYKNLYEQHAVKRTSKVLGILAFLNPFHLDNIHLIKKILIEVGISEIDFNDQIQQLHKLEIVDIHFDKVVKVSDQCLYNYLLKHIFIDNESISLSLMIMHSFTNFQVNVINSINILHNIFYSSELFNKIEKEVSVAWEYFKKEEDELFYKFVKAFYLFKPIDSLLIIKNKIDKIKPQTFAIRNIDFEKEKNNAMIYDDVLVILGGFSNHKNSPEALELLFVYYKKSPQLFMEVYHMILSYFGIKNTSFINKYDVQVKLFNVFSNELKDLQNDVIIMFLRIAKEFLKLIFISSEEGRKNKITIYNTAIRKSKNAKEYRKLIWENLIKIYSVERFREDVQNIVKEYGTQIRDEVDVDIIISDFLYIEKLFFTGFESQVLAHCLIAHNIDLIKRKYKIVCDINLSRFIESKKYITYSTLKGKEYYGTDNRKNRSELKKRAIIDLFSNVNKVDIIRIIDLCNEIVLLKQKSVWKLQQGLFSFFELLSKRKGLFIFAIKKYLERNTPLDILPDQIVIWMFNSYQTEKVYEVIISNDYDSKNKWLFSFYKNIPVKYISKKHVKKFYEFLIQKNENLTISSYRSLDFLLNYKKHDEDIIIKASEIIINKFKYSPFIFSLYFQLWFNISHLDSERLIKIYDNHFDLLKKIYFHLITYDDSTDYEGYYLLSFVKKDNNFLEEYVNFYIKQKNKNDRYVTRDRLSNAWDDENYCEIFSQIVKLVDVPNLDNWEKVNDYKVLFAFSEKNDERSRRQDKWLSNFIDNNYDNIELICMIFGLIQGIPAIRKKKHIIHFTRKNKDFIAFSKIPLKKNNWFSWGGLTPVFEEEIKFLESLLQELSGICYLEHTQRIKKEIIGFKRVIQQEKISEIMDY